MNLIAPDTREGKVMETLLEKLERIRKQLNSDKVFDVIGRLFQGVSIKQYMEAAIEEDDADTVASKLGGILTKEQVEALAEREKKLFGDGGDVKRELPRIRSELDNEAYRRLLPGYVRQYIENAAPLVDIQIEGDAREYFSLTPARRGAIDRILPTLDSYPVKLHERLTVSRPPSKTDGIWVHPGEPVFEEFRSIVSDRLSAEASRGAVFVDPNSDRPYLFHLALVSVVREADPQMAEFSATAALECRLVGVKQFEGSELQVCPVEHLLLLKGGEGLPPAAQRLAVAAPGYREQASAFIVERVARQLAVGRKELLLSTLEEREGFLRRGFSYQEAELAAARAKHAEKRGIEVKGRGTTGDVELFSNEWAKACNLGQGYWLYVVYDCAISDDVARARLIDEIGKTKALSLLSARFNEIAPGSFPAYTALRKRPFTFEGRLQELVEAAATKARCTHPLLKHFTIRPKYAIDCRLLEAMQGDLCLVLTVAVDTKWTIDASLESLQQAGVSVRGLYAVRRAPAEGQRRLLGRVESIQAGQVRFSESIEEVGAVPSDEVRLEGSLQNFAHCLKLLVGASYPVFDEQRRVEEATVMGGPAQRDAIAKMGEWLRKRPPIDLAPGVRCSIGAQVDFQMTGRQPSAWTGTPVEYCFDAAKSKRSKYAWTGLVEFGPFDRDTFARRSPRVLVVTPDTAQGAAEQFVKALLEGVQSVSPSRYAQGLTRLFGLTKPNVDILAVPVSKNPGPVHGVYKSALEEHLARRADYEVAIVVIDERVELRMLEPSALVGYTGDGTESAKFLDSLAPFDFPAGSSNVGKSAKAQFQQQLQALENDEWLVYDSQNSALLAAVVPLLAGAAIDFVVGKLDETAKSFEAQWGTSRMVDGWWTPTTAEDRWRPRFVGVEVVRSTSKFPASSGGASRLVLLFLPSKSDNRLFVVYPLFYGNRSPKASVSSDGQSLAATISMSANATWVGKDDRAVQAEVAQAVFEVTGYSTSTPGAVFWRMPDQDSVGWFAAGPTASPTPRNADSAAGVFRIAVALTEKDEGESRQWIERASKYVTENREKVIEAAKAGAGGSK